MSRCTRRGFLVNTAAAAGTITAWPAWRASAAASAGPMKLGIVTYNIAKDWDIPTIIRNCRDTGYDGVELRTGHAHKVEVTLTPDQRREVKAQFENSPVRIAQLGSTYEFHSTDPAEVRRNVEGCKQYIQLARDVGAPAVKVRPNGLQTKSGVPVQTTLEQIGKCLAELGRTGSDQGIEVRVEVHGPETSRIEHIQKIMEVANHPMVTVNWNSNQSDLEGGLEQNFARLAPKIRHVHMRDLYVDEYPWRKLIGLLTGIRFGGYCCAEIPESSDPLRVMRYFRAVFLAYQPQSV